jgi:hypothetical protein
MDPVFPWPWCEEASVQFHPKPKTACFLCNYKWDLSPSPQWPCSLVKKFIDVSEKRTVFCLHDRRVNQATARRVSFTGVEINPISMRVTHKNGAAKRRGSVLSTFAARTQHCTTDATNYVALYRDPRRPASAASELQCAFWIQWMAPKLGA